MTCHLAYCSRSTHFELTRNLCYCAGTIVASIYCIRVPADWALGAYKNLYGPDGVLSRTRPRNGAYGTLFNGPFSRPRNVSGGFFCGELRKELVSVSLIRSFIRSFIHSSPLISSHLISSHPIQSHLTSSHLISSHPIPSHPIPAHLISSNPVSSHRMSPHLSHLMSSRAMSNYVISSHLISSRLM